VDDTAQFYVDATIDLRRENVMKDRATSGN
jgi:hypothetical protein